MQSVNKVALQKKIGKSKIPSMSKNSLNISLMPGRKVSLVVFQRFVCGLSYILRHHHTACWHLTWIILLAFSKLLSFILLIFQKETMISGSKDYILMLLIACALPSFRAKIKSCCDFSKCRPPLQLSRRHCVIINLNHCQAQSIPCYKALPFCVKGMIWVLWFSAGPS